MSPRILEVSVSVVAILLLDWCFRLIVEYRVINRTIKVKVEIREKLFLSNKATSSDLGCIIVDNKSSMKCAILVSSLVR